MVIVPMKSDAVDSSTCPLWMDLLFSSSEKNRGTLLKFSKEVGTGKLRMLISCYENVGEGVAEFRCFGTVITNQNYIHKEI
jgi:hypothetical protein